MTWIDWLIFGVYLAGVVLFGIVQSRKSSGIEGYFLAGRTLPWGTIGALGNGYPGQCHHLHRNHRTGL